MAYHREIKGAFSDEKYRKELMSIRYSNRPFVKLLDRMFQRENWEHIRGIISLEDVLSLYRLYREGSGGRVRVRVYDVRNGREWIEAMALEEYLDTLTDAVEHYVYRGRRLAPVAERLAEVRRCVEEGRECGEKDIPEFVVTALGRRSFVLHKFKKYKEWGVPWEFLKRAGPKLVDRLLKLSPEKIDGAMRLIEKQNGQKIPDLLRMISPDTLIYKICRTRKSR